ADSGRPSIAPERLLRALLLQAFYTIRSESQLMEQINYNLLYRWFVGLGVDEPVWVQTVFTKNRERLLEAEVAHKFLAELLNHKDAVGRAFLGRRHADSGLGLDEELPRQGRLGRAAGGRPQRRARLPWREAQQRHAYLDHRPGSEAASQGQRQGGQALLYRQRHDRDPSRAGGGGRARLSDRHHRARGGTDDGGALFAGLAASHARC